MSPQARPDRPAQGAPAGRPLSIGLGTGGCRGPLPGAGIEGGGSGAAAARKFGPIRVLTIGAVLGSVALMWVGLADSLPMLIAAQVLAGGAWGVVFMASISTALNLGTVGREGLVLGLWFSVISLATLVRAGLVAGGVKADPELLASLQWAPPILLRDGVLRRMLP